jgi:hypothetical protein
MILPSGRGSLEGALRAMQRDLRLDGGRMSARKRQSGRQDAPGALSIGTDHFARLC